MTKPIIYRAAEIQCINMDYMNIYWWTQERSVYCILINILVCFCIINFFSSGFALFFFSPPLYHLKCDVLSKQFKKTKISNRAHVAFFYWDSEQNIVGALEKCFNYLLAFPLAVLSAERTFYSVFYVLASFIIVTYL